MKPGKASDSNIATLNLASEDTATFYKLPKEKHNDPFDRLLIWQAINNNLTLVSKDREMKSYKQYGLKTLW